MADRIEFDKDTGIVTSPPRFAGRHIDAVMQYLDALEDAVTNPSLEAPKPPTNGAPASQPPKAKTPEQLLEEQGRGRVDPLAMATAARLEADDEAEFSSSVSDYDKYKADIDKIKATLNLGVRTQKGVHRTLYIQVKTSASAKARARVFEPDKEDETEEEKAAREETERVAAEAEADRKAREAAQRGPKPAPPMAAPTPASRAATQPGKQTKSKLIATDKVREFCRRTGQNVDAYLLRLEQGGMTQEGLDNAGQMGRREDTSGRTHAYDRKRATSR